MKPGERIPIHDHRDHNSGGIVAASTTVTAVGSGGTSGSPATTASAVTIADIDGHYTSADVEGALAEAAVRTHALDDLSDVTAPTPSDNDVLAWDAGTSAWVPVAPTSTVATLDAIGDVNAPAPSDGDVLTWDSTPGEWVALAPSGGPGGGDTSGQFTAGFDAGTSALTAGHSQDVSAPYTGTITGWTMLGNASGSASIGVAKATYAGFDTFASIVAAAPPAMSGTAKATSSTLTGWTTAVTAGDVLRFTLSAVSGLSRLVVVLTYSRP